MPKDGSGTIWINDYRMVYKKGEYFEIDEIKQGFQEAFDAIWSGFAENLLFKSKSVKREYFFDENS